MARNQKLEARATLEEFNQVAAAAAAEGFINVSEYIRRKLLQDADITFLKGMRETLDGMNETITGTLEELRGEASRQQDDDAGPQLEEIKATIERQGEEMRAIIERQGEELRAVIHEERQPIEKEEPKTGGDVPFLFGFFLGGAAVFLVFKIIG